ncbi:hypothetical protein GS885_28345 [Rhodococcus hoagii]|nr:hypothetical protein [Prescottella equi]NKT61548.1 hypothetical protein [Prescottella equi]NKV13024.1 hypothetical protein [Prescottella equi]
MDEMIPAAQAAEILGVTDARIRQLTAAERITGHVYGPRVVLYNRAEIEVYKRMTGGAEVTSGIAATAPTLDEPLRLNDDTVLNIPIPNALGDTNIHVRIWKSDRRTLVLVAPVAGSTIAVDGWHFEEYILPTVSDTFLHGDSLTPIWITASHHSDHELYYANQVVMVYEAEQEEPSGWRALWNRRLKSDSTEPRVRVATITLKGGVDAIDRLTGNTVRFFPEQNLATPERIGELSRHPAHPVAATVDRPELRATANAMREIAEHRNTDPVTADVALRALSHRIDVILQAPASSRQPKWMTALTDDEARPRNGLDAVHCAVAPHEDLLEDVDWRAIADPVAPTVDELKSAWSGLGAWLDTVEEFAPEADRNPELAAALDRAMREVWRRYRAERYTDPTIAELLPYPATKPRAYAVSPITEDYWNQCVPGAAESTELRRLMHHLDRRLVSLSGSEIGVRTSREGLPVTRYVWDRNPDRQDIIIMWPELLPDYPRIPEGSRIVATGDGDAAVFIRRPDGALTPVPRPAKMSEHSGWSWGYDGSGPGALAAAIAELLGVSDNADYTPHWRTIDKMLAAAPESHLDLAIDDVRAAIASAPQS